MNMKIFPMDEKYQDYLTDESCCSGSAESISFPESEEQIREIYQSMRNQGTPVTLQGGRTGIVGGAVPEGGHVMNLSKMNSAADCVQVQGGRNLLKVEPGVTLLDLQKHIRKISGPVQLCWPPDPTEPTASIGGIISSGAKGCSSWYYGETASYVEALRYLDRNGEFREITRGENSLLFHGTYIDEIDLLIGSEGIYGVITEATLKLVPAPSVLWGICFFFRDRYDCLAFGEQMRVRGTGDDVSAVTVLEYIDRKSIDIAEKQKPHMTNIRDLPDVPSEMQAMVFCEIHGSSEQAVEQRAGMLLELSENHRCSPEDTWAMTGEYGVEKLRAFRHAVPESVNKHIRSLTGEHPGIMKLGTDMMMKGYTSIDAVDMYENQLRQAGLEGCIFGHMGSGHLHMNILPKDIDEYHRGRELLAHVTLGCSQRGGRAFTEHGIGKVKREVYAALSGKQYIDEICRKKQELDPELMWNPGNVVDFSLLEDP